MHFNEASPHSPVHVPFQGCKMRAYSNVSAVRATAAGTRLHKIHFRGFIENVSLEYALGMLSKESYTPRLTCIDIRQLSYRFKIRDRC